jgi:hypothetical protein
VLYINYQDGCYSTSLHVVLIVTEGRMHFIHHSSAIQCIFYERDFFLGSNSLCSSSSNPSFSDCASTVATLGPEHLSPEPQTCYKLSLPNTQGQPIHSNSKYNMDQLGTCVKTNKLLGYKCTILKERKKEGRGISTIQVKRHKYQGY